MAIPAGPHAMPVIADRMMRSGHCVATSPPMPLIVLAPRQWSSARAYTTSYPSAALAKLRALVNSKALWKSMPQRAAATSAWVRLLTPRVPEGSGGVDLDRAFRQAELVGDIAVVRPRTIRASTWARGR